MYVVVFVYAPRCMCVYVFVVFSSIFYVQAYVCVHAVMMVDFILVHNPGVNSGRRAYCQNTHPYTPTCTKL